MIIFGKGPTYLGVWPVFWGELVLGALVVWMLWHMHRERVPIRTMLTSGGKMVLAFMSLGVALTMIGFDACGIDAFRDAAIWYYGAFYFVGFFLARRSLYAHDLWSRLQVVWLLALVWNAIDIAGGEWLTHASPLLAQHGVYLLGGSGSENVQHMMLGVVLVILGAASPKRTGWFCWVIFLMAVLAVGCFIAEYARGVKLAVAAGLVMALMATWRSRPSVFPRSTLIGGAILVLAALVAASMVMGEDELASVARVDRFEELSRAGETGTAYWRLVWWQNILEALHEHNPIFGLGLGTDLAVLHPMIGASPEMASIRSPHNFNMTVLGRMGYAGMALWLLVLFGGLGRLFLRLWRGGFAGRGYTLERSKELAFWLMMLTATWVNASMGILMEGPVLGIPFWFCLGFAMGRSEEADGVVFSRDRASATGAGLEATRC